MHTIVTVLIKRIMNAQARVQANNVTLGGLLSEILFYSKHTQCLWSKKCISY